MDFEVLDAPEPQITYADSLARFFNSRRKQLQDWDAAPPVLLGFLIFCIAIFELSLGIHLIKHAGIKNKFVSTVFSLGFLFLIFELLFVSVAKQLAVFFKKTGKPIAAWTFLNIGLTPYLIFLPIALCATLAGASHTLVFLLFVLLSFKVLGNWKEGIEVAFELSKLQGAIVVYALSGLAMMLAGLFVYVSFLKVIADFL